MYFTLQDICTITDYNTISFPNLQLHQGNYQQALTTHHQALARRAATSEGSPSKTFPKGPRLLGSVMGDIFPSHNSNSKILETLHSIYTTQVLRFYSL